MQDYIQKKDPKVITFNQQVVAIRPDGPGMQVTVMGSDGKSANIKYDSVISTLPLTCLRSLDIYKCDMSPLQANALRELDYGPSIKIGIKFKTAWWATAKDKDGNPINVVGGQSYTDRPIRTVVYPSYSFSDPPSSPKTTVLIASYCWTDDAERLGSLIATGKQQFDQQLLTLTIRDLADVHNLDYDWLFSQIENPQRDVFAWDWNHDPLTQGTVYDFDRVYRWG
jgi:monoamine oxidase